MAKRTRTMTTAAAIMKQGRTEERKAADRSKLRGKIAMASCVAVLTLTLTGVLLSGILPGGSAGVFAEDGVLKSVSGKNIIPDTYTAFNVPAGTRTMTAEEYKTASVPGKSADGIAAFDFHIFADKFAANVHTCGNIAVNELGYNVLGSSGAPEFGSRKDHDLDVDRVSYVGKFNSWTNAANADCFVFGPEVKISGGVNRQVFAGNTMIGNDNNGSLVDKMYIEQTPNSFLNIQRELSEAEDYMRYNVWLMNKAKAESSKVASVELGNSEFTTVQYLDNKVMKNGTIDLTPYTSADTITIDVTADQLKSFLKNTVNIKGTAGKRILFNVDCTNFNGNELVLGDVMMTADALKNCEETANYDNNILWNFYKMENGAPESYTGIVNPNGTWIGTMNVPMGKVRCYAGLNGSIIAQEVTSRNETHKSDYTGERVRVKELEVSVHKVWRDDPGARPDYITLKLKRNGEVYKTVQITEDDCDSSESFDWFYSFKNLPATDAAGNTYQYKVEEVVPAGYTMAQMNNTIVNSSQGGIVPVKNKLTVKKQDNSGKQLPGATFELTSKTGANLSKATANSDGYKSGSLKVTGSKITWVSTDKPIVIDNLPDGSYTVTEIAAPAGYKKADAADVDLSGSKTVTVKNSPLSFDVSKLNGSSASGREFLAGSTFELTAQGVDLSKGSVQGAKSGSAEVTGSKIKWVSGYGKVTVSGIPAGTYTVTETAAPDGFDIAAPVTLILDENGKVTVGGQSASGVEVKDYLIPEEEKLYSLIIRKHGAYGGDADHAITGAQLELYSVAGKKLRTDYSVTVTGAQSSSVTDEKISLITNGADIAVSGLPAGSYTLKEVFAPAGFALASDLAITLNADGTVADMKDESNEFRIMKLDGASGMPIAGAHLQLIYRGEVLDDWYTSGGIETIAGALPGEYILREAEAPAGYRKAADITFTLDEYGKLASGADGVVLGRDIRMVDEPYQISVSKRYWNDKDKDGKLESGETGILGGATLVLTAKTSGVNLANVSGSINVVPEVSGPSGVTAIRWVSGSEENILSALPDGVYELTEKEAPEGFDKSAGATITVSGGKITAVTALGSGDANKVDSSDSSIGLYDKKIQKHSIAIEKFDELGETLPGAQFAVYAKTGDTAPAEFDPEDAIVLFESGDEPQKLILPDGDYWLVETSAPEGYTRLETPVAFTVHDGELGDITGGSAGGTTERDASFTANVISRDELFDRVNKAAGGYDLAASSQNKLYDDADTKYVCVELGEYMESVDTVTVNYSNGTSAPAFAHSFKKPSGTDYYTNSGTKYSNYTTGELEIDEIDVKSTDDHFVIVGQYNNDHSDAQDPLFDSVTVKFKDGVTVTIPKEKWGGVEKEATGGSTGGVLGEFTGECTVSPNVGTATYYPVSENAAYQSFLASHDTKNLLSTNINGQLKKTTNNYIVVDFSDYAKSLSNDVVIDNIKVTFESATPIENYKTYGTFAMLVEDANNLSFVNGERIQSVDGTLYTAYLDYSAGMRLVHGKNNYLIFTPSNDGNNSAVVDGTAINFDTFTLDIQTGGEDITVAAVREGGSGSGTGGNNDNGREVFSPSKVEFYNCAGDSAEYARYQADLTAAGVWDKIQNITGQVDGNTYPNEPRYTQQADRLKNPNNNYMVVDLSELAGTEMNVYDVVKVKVTLSDDATVISDGAYGTTIIAASSDFVKVCEAAKSMTYDSATHTAVSENNEGFRLWGNTHNLLIITAQSESPNNSTGLPLDIEKVELEFKNNAIKPATVYCTKEAYAKAGYLTVAKPVTIKVTVPAPGGGASADNGDGTEPPTLKVTNVPIPEENRYVYGFTLNKKDENDSLITTGTASFKVYNSKDKQLAFELKDGKYVYDPEATKTAGTVIETVNGVLTVEGLEEGSYYLYETAAPENYILSGDRIDITLPAENGTTLEAVNNSVTGELLITKVDNMGGTRSGAQFSLWFSDDTAVPVRQGDTVGYYVYDPASSSNIITTGDSGHITVTGLPLDKTYYAIETGAPAGCSIKTTAKLPSETGIALTYENNSGAFTVEDDANETAFAKVDETGAPVEGATLRLTPAEMSDDPRYPVFAGVGVDNGVQVDYQLIYDYAADAEGKAILNEDGGQIINGISAEYIEWISLADGPVKFYGLPAGTYTFEEIEAPAGYSKAAAQTIVIAADGTVSGVDTVTMTDTTQSGSITLTKRDSLDGSTLAGAKFVLQAEAAYVTATDGVYTGTVATQDEATVFTTLADGTVSVTGLPFGVTYTFVEIEAPAGYQTTAGQDLSVTVAADDLNKTVEALNDRVNDGAFVLYKRDSVSDQPIVGVTFKLMRKVTGTGDEFTQYGDILTTDGNGEIVLTDLPWGYTYKLIETGSVAGYAFDPAAPSESGEFTVSEGGVTSPATGTVYNTANFLKVSKLDATDGAKLAGATLCLSGDSLAGVTATGATDTDDDPNTFTWITGDADAVFTGMAPGTYTVTELEAPTGYEKTAAVTVTVTADGKVITGETELTAKTVVLADTRKTGAVTLTKKGNGGETIANVEFLLCADNGSGSKSFVKSDGGLTDNADEALVLKTGPDGTVTISNLVWGVEYAFYEKTIPAGYKTPADRYTEFTIPNTLTQTVEVINVSDQLSISKRAVTNGPEIQGARLTLTAADSAADLSGVTGSIAVTCDESAKNIISWTSGAAQNILTGLPAGQYLLTEELAPNGYATAESISFRLDDAGKVYIGTSETPLDESTVVMLDEVITATFSKTDAGAGSELPGATLVLTAKDTNADLSAVKGDNAKVTADKNTLTWVSGTMPNTLTAIPSGTYTLTEYTAPAGYLVAESITFTIGADGKVYKGEKAEGTPVDRNTVLMKDQPLSATISKVDAGAGTELPGATLVITAKDEKADLGKVRGDNAKVTVEKNQLTWVSTDKPNTISALPAGTYTLTEYTAPDGYTVAESMTFTVGSDGKVYLGEKAEGTPVTSNTVVMKDEPVKVTISKQSLSGKTELPGAKLQVALVKAANEGADLSKVVGVPAAVTYDKNANTVTWTSGAAANVLSSLPAGEYVLKELEAPTGYLVADDIYFRVTAIGKIQSAAKSDYKTDGTTFWSDPLADGKVTMYDASQTFTFTFNKMSMLNKPLDGAGFRLTGTGYDKTVSSANGGVVTFTGVPAGQYTLTESFAPQGYVASLASITVNVAEDGSFTFKSGDKDITYSDVETLMINKVTPSSGTPKTELKPGDGVDLKDELLKQKPELKDQPITWESSNPNVVSVDENGKARVLGAGTSTVTAKVNGNPVMTFVLGSSEGNSVNVNGDYSPNTRDMMFKYIAIAGTALALSAMVALAAIQLIRKRRQNGSND